MHFIAFFCFLAITSAQIIGESYHQCSVLEILHYQTIQGQQSTERRVTFKVELIKNGIKYVGYVDDSSYVTMIEYLNAMNNGLNVSCFLDNNGVIFKDSKYRDSYYSLIDSIDAMSNKKCLVNSIIHYEKTRSKITSTYRVIFNVTYTLNNTFMYLEKINMRWSYGELLRLMDRGLSVDCLIEKRIISKQSSPIEEIKETIPEETSWLTKIYIAFFAVLFVVYFIPLQ